MSFEVFIKDVISQRYKKPVHEGLKGLNIEKKFKKAKKIIIKPNLATGHLHNWETGVTVSPFLVEEIIQYINIINNNVSIFIVESDSLNEGYTYQKFAYCHYNRLENTYPNVRLIDLTRSAITKKHIDGLYLKEIYLPLILDKYDLFISVSKIKTHTLTQISGGLKNQFGCIPQRGKNRYHPYIKEVLIDINKQINPDIVILDGNPAMEGLGPVHGDLRNIGLILFSHNATAIDTVMSTLIGFNPKKIPLLRMAAKYGLGPIDLNEITIKGSLNRINPPFRWISTPKKAYSRFGLFLGKIGDKLSQLGANIHFNVEKSYKVREETVGHGNTTKNRRRAIKNYVVD